MIEERLKDVVSRLPELLRLATLTSGAATRTADPDEDFDLPEADADAEAQDTNINLKRVLYPMALIKRFADLADENTKRKIETCGILCGSDRDGKLFITNILIPDQRGNSDSCTTLDYEAMSKYVMTNNLIVLGWIHTHPEYVMHDSHT